MNTNQLWGPLALYMDNPQITEIMVNGPQQIFVEEDGVVLSTSSRFDSEDHLRLIVDRILADVGRRVDLSSPMCDARLADGSRLNVVIPPIALNGTKLTLRRFRADLLTLAALREKGTLTEGQSQFLIQSVRERKNIVVAGNSSSGKTTLLNILSGFMGPDERVITIEDTAELQIQKNHVLRLETRPANAEGKGAISLSDLVVNALRMRPDRLIIGECRGPEVVSLLQALNTGHSGSMSTLHANSAEDALQRLKSLVLCYAPQWPLEVIDAQISTAIDVVVYLHREGQRRVCRDIVSLKKSGDVFCESLG